MSHDPHDVSKRVRIYFIVGFALLVGTVVTVAVNYLHFDSMALTIAIALFIACVKGFLVAGYFMHLLSEKKMIYCILGATAFFFAGMMYLTIYARDDMPHGSLHTGSGKSFEAPAKAAAPSIPLLWTRTMPSVQPASSFSKSSGIAAVPCSTTSVVPWGR